MSRVRQTIEGGRMMKIIVDKYEYAKMIRSCQKTIEGYGCTSKCILAEVCEGQKWLEDHSDVIKEQINETD